MDKMKYSSLGYHTFDIFRKLTVDEGDTLLSDFIRYRNQTGLIRIRQPNDDDADLSSDTFNEKLKTQSRYFLIEPTSGMKGLSWLLRLTPKSPGFMKYQAMLDGGMRDTDRPCSIKARINPKPFTGVYDYLAAANASYLDEVEERFNRIASAISPLLGCFAGYEFNRIDFCVNFALRELGIDCDPLLIMELIRRGDVPKHFYPALKKYIHTDSPPPFDSKTVSIDGPHADDTDHNSFVLNTDSININCYYKYAQLRKQFPDCPNIRESTDIIRFEVQCLYHKVYYMAKDMRSRPGFTDLFSDMLSDDTANGEICNYFYKVVKPGDYYSMDEAIKKIQSYDFHPKKENRLIATLKTIEIYGSIAKAKATINKPDVQEDFRRSLRELADIKINPVTIPEHYGVAHIPNLLDAYYAKRFAEREAERDAKMYEELFNEFHSKKSHKHHKK